jgi:hypothetical protein
MARATNRHRRRPVVAVLGLALSLTTAGPAFADVGVTPSSEPAGGSGELTFRVTDDIPDAGTTSFELDLPTDHPLLGVVPAAKFGWGLAIERSPVPGPTAGRVTRIIWSAHSTTTAIQPGRYGTFSISVREFPIAAARVRISALQTWSNGEVVQWIDPLVPGRPTPLHPAPEITLTAGGPTSRPAIESSGPTEAATASQTPSVSATPTATPLPVALPGRSGPSSRLVDTAIGLSVGAVGLALIAIAMAGVALARKRSDGRPPIST